MHPLPRSVASEGRLDPDDECDLVRMLEPVECIVEVVVSLELIGLLVCVTAAAK
jgi:hypothetical protein